MSDSRQIPAWSLGWRLKRSLALTDMDASAIGARIGRKRGAVSAWMNDHGAPPADAFLHRWADLCDVSYDWLVTGEGSINEPLRHSRQEGPAITPERDAALRAEDEAYAQAEVQSRPDTARRVPRQS